MLDRNVLRKLRGLRVVEPVETAPTPAPVQPQAPARRWNAMDLPDEAWAIISQQERAGASHAQICAALRRGGFDETVFPPPPPVAATSTMPPALVSTESMNDDEFRIWKSDPVGGEREILRRRAVAAAEEAERNGGGPRAA